MQFPLIALILIISLTAISTFRRSRQNNPEGKKQSYSPAGLNKGRWLLYSGLMLLGVSMGIFTGITIAAVFGFADQVSWLIIGSILLFTGICAIICHRIEKKER